MHKEFFEFLKKYGVIGLAIAVVIGGKLNAFVTAIVDNVIMPIVSLLSPGGKMGDMQVGIFKFGPVISTALDFLIVALLVFFFAKWVLKEDVVAKK